MSKEPKKRPEYEMFMDVSYFDYWCVRNKDDRRFCSPTNWHFLLKKDAEEFKRLLELAE